MSSISAVTFNSGSTIDGTLQVGQLAIGSTPQDYSNDPGGLKWWSSADLDSGYIIAHVNPNANQPNSQGITGVKVGFWRTQFTDSDFISWAEYIAKRDHTPQTFSTATEANIWLFANGYWTSYLNDPTPTITLTPTSSEIPVTPTPTSTTTPSVTSTQTPTPSTTPIPVTGYGYNLVVLPYNPPTSGNTIFPTFASPGLNSGTTNPNTFDINAIYWNSIDNTSVDRTSYYSGMTGVSVTAYFTQNGHTAIYSGSPTAFTYDGPTGQQSFNYNPNDRPEQLLLIQSASTNFVTGQTVYISYVVNTTVTPTPTPTNTQTSTPTNTVTPTNTPTPSSTPSLVTSGLIIQLDAYENSSYSGSGTNVVNIQSPGTYDHTLTGADYVVLNGIKCFDCTTGTDRVVVNGTGPTLPTSGYTYITWARLEPGDPASFRTLLYTNSPKYTPITIPDNSDILGYWDSAFRSSGYNLSGQTEIWVQYAVVGTDSSQTFYINGSQVGSTIAFGAGGTTHWGWGNNDTALQPWGYVANMYFYNRILSLSEITQQYNFLAPRFVEGL